MYGLVLFLVFKEMIKYGINIHQTLCNRGAGVEERVCLVRRVSV